MLDVEQRSGVTVVRLSHGKVNALDLDLLQAITAAPARERIAARRGDDEAVLATWSSAQTREVITGYLSTLRQRPR